MKLTGANTYIGDTSVAGGTLAFSALTSSMAGGNYAVSGGTLNIGTILKTIGTLQITDGAITGFGRLTNSAGFDVQGGTISTSLAGTGALSKTGPGTAVLNGSGGNLIYYTGGTTISGGTLLLQDVNFTTDVSNYSILEFQASSRNVTFIGAVSGSGSLTKIGSNTLTLGGSTGNSYTGDTNVAEGILTLSKSSGLAIPGNLNLSAFNGSTETRVQGNNQISSSTVINFLGGSSPNLNFSATPSPWPASPIPSAPA